MYDAGIILENIKLRILRAQYFNWLLSTAAD